MRQNQKQNENRTPEQIREHYEIEKKLASKLRQASKEERLYLYSALYDELYQRVPFHPLLTRKKSPAETLQAVESQMTFLMSFLSEDITFIEIGPGDCSLSYEVAKYVKQVYAVDVSNEITKTLNTPANFQLIISDGCSVPVTPNTVNIAYSNQLMEHLHPDDAFEQLQNIYNALDSDGIYICITPNKLTGPADVSRYFDEVATGFHLKEYTVSELNQLFKKVGFSKVKAYVGAKKIYMKIPIILLILFEQLLCTLPYKVRKAILRSKLIRILLNVRLIGIK